MLCKDLMEHGFKKIQFCLYNAFNEEGCPKAAFQKSESGFRFISTDQFKKSLKQHDQKL